MGLFSSFKSSADTAHSGAASDAGDIVQDARSRARRRLIGAAVLLGVGIIGFPLLFETQPRPIPVDIPIDIPSREGLPPLVSPASRPGAARAHADSEPSPQADGVDKAVAAANVKPMVDEPPLKGDKTEKAAGAGSAASPLPAKPVAEPRAAVVKPTPAPAPPPSAPAKPPENKPAEARTKPAVSPPADVRTPESKASESKAPAKPTDTATDTGRWVVQIGAFAEVNSAREARMKVEGLGLKTYTQVIESPTGRRIRVRVGPYASKADAEKAAARIKAGGLQTALLLL